MIEKLGDLNKKVDEFKVILLKNTRKTSRLTIQNGNTNNLLNQLEKKGILTLG